MTAAMMNELDRLRAEVASLKQERDALAAHVDQMRDDIWNQASKIHGEFGVRETVEDFLPDSYAVSPAVSLARRDLIKQAEAMEDMVDIVHPDDPSGSLKKEAKRLRQQAEGLK